MRVIRLVWAVAFVVSIGCKRENPEFCCVSEAECAAAGANGIRPCDPGQSCIDNKCVSASCETPADCHDPMAPSCANGMCTPGCELDTDCAGITGLPYCIDNECVECKVSAQCPASAEICDLTTHACRGCTADDECASGVCIEADGRCASVSELVYVSSLGADVGDCTLAQPCLSIA